MKSLQRLAYQKLALHNSTLCIMAHSGLFEKQPDSGHSDVLEIYHFTTTLVYA